MNLNALFDGKHTASKKEPPNKNIYKGLMHPLQSTFELNKNTHIKKKTKSFQSIKEHFGLASLPTNFSNRTFP